MRSTRSVRLLLSVLAVFTLAASIGAQAPDADGRDFFGFYELADVVEGGSLVTLRFRAQVFNHGATPLIGATVIVEDLQASPSGELLSLGPVSIEVGEGGIVAGNVTVPLDVYERWMALGVPGMWIDHWASDGRRYRRPVELMQGPVAEEVQ